MDRLRQHFTGIASKYLSSVDATAASNQHEIGSNAFAKILGQPGTQTIPFQTTFLYFDDGFEPLKAGGVVSWYDARRNNPARRPELRLYYPDNIVTQKMTAGDFCLIAQKTDQSLMVIVAPPDSTMERQLRWLFSIGDVSGDRFKAQDVSHERQISLVELILLEELGVEVRQDDYDWLDVITGQFGLEFPSTSVFSSFARKTCPVQHSVEQEPDQVLMDWMWHEEMLFRTLERSIVQKHLDAGFQDVDHFIKVSLSVQNRRKSRVGHALEHHLAAIFSAHQLPFSRQAVTEQKSTTDFLFPSTSAYQAPSFPDNGLVMLAAKSSCKDRWRQVLAEAKRIQIKHLLTLEPAISVHQTNEMSANGLYLVVPQPLQNTYSPTQQAEILGLGSFIEHVKGVCM